MIIIPWSLLFGQRFSYGVVVWELLTGETPYKGVEDFAILFGVGSDILHLPIPSTCPAAFKDMLQRKSMLYDNNIS